MAQNQRYLSADQLTSLVDRALRGDEAAWSALVEGLQRVVWKAVNMMTSDHDIRSDAFAATWLRLAERLATIREPHKLPGWLTTTATNEVRQIVRQRGRQHTSLSGTAGDDGSGTLVDTLVGDHGTHDEELVAAEQRREVRAAFARLDEPCREIITVLVLADPPIPYDQAATQLGRPIGALGPTRGRCLGKLKELLTPTNRGSDHHG